MDEVITTLSASEVVALAITARDCERSGRGLEVAVHGGRLFFIPEDPAIAPRAFARRASMPTRKGDTKHLGSSAVDT
jgi:hypothetical protein